ncbi:MAG: tail fiber protein [Cellvibrionales bacterium]|nr:tail fiber protein [Cellvibrionales bacterium]
MKMIQSYVFILVTSGLSLFSPSIVASCSQEPTLGSICFTAANFCPRGYAKAAGQIVAISSNQALYSLLGTNYGGDGRTSFGYPELRGRSVIGTNNKKQLGQGVGHQLTTITQANIMSHSHSLDVSSINTLKGTLNVNASGANHDNPTGLFLANLAALGSADPNIFPYKDSGTETTMLPNMVKGQFANASVPTTSGPLDVQFVSEGPRLVLTACVAITGLYPSRN